MRQHKQCGYLTLLAILFIVVMGAIGASLSTILLTRLGISNDNLQALRALFIAESGLERARHALFSLNPVLTDRLTRRYACDATHFPPQTLGQGEYTLFGRPSAASTRIVSPINATDTEIPVSSITGFASFGQLIVEKEAVNYAGVSTTSCANGHSCFTGAIRGTNGTTATSHKRGAVVSQFMCMVTSIGAVPTITNPQGLRRITQAAPLQRIWAVGDKRDDRYYILSWRGDRWTQETHVPSGAENLKGISMLSYADGWAVGDQKRFLRWNGERWSNGVTSGLPRRNFKAVDCVSQNECYAIGEKDGRFLIALWNGNLWTRSPVNASEAEDLHAIKCIGPSNCWAAGDKKDSFLRLHGRSWTNSGFTLNANVPDKDYEGIDCPDKTRCFAVGRKGGGSVTIVQWLSSTNEWRKQSILGTNPDVDLHAIACGAPNDCWAVGDGRVFMHWNGARWSQFPVGSSIPGKKYYAVACYSPSDCWASGEVNDQQALLVHWDGASWTLTPTRNLPIEDLRAIGITGPSNPGMSGIWKTSF